MEVIELERGNKVMRALKKEKSRLEAKYFVHISKTSCPAIIYALKVFYSNLAAPDELEIRKKAVEILDRACKLVAERFTNCAYEGEFYEKQNQLCRALVDVKELCKDYDNPDSWDWLTQEKRERDEASTFLADFLARWNSVLDSSVFSWICRQEDASRLRMFEIFALKLEKEQSSTASPQACRSIRRFLDKVKNKLIIQFGSLLTVTADHVGEVKVVSSLTDIPLAEFVPSISAFKEAALYKTKQRVVDQDNTIDGIFEVLASRRSSSHMTARPRGLFFLVGQNGVGTEIAKAVAEHWYGDVSRLVEIDMSGYRDAGSLLSARTCKLSSRQWIASFRPFSLGSLVYLCKSHTLGSFVYRSKSELEHFRNRLSEVVRKRPYSVILLDRVQSAIFCAKGFMEDLRDDVPTNIESCSVDFSKSIIFMTSGLGHEGLSDCACLDNNSQFQEELKRDPVEFERTHVCSAMNSKTALSVARWLFGAELLDSVVDRVFHMERLRSKKAVCRMLLREIVREASEGRFLLHISDAALNVVLWNARAMFLTPTSAKALKTMLDAEVRPWLAAAGGYNNAVVYVDTLVGTGELSFRFEANKRFLADCYFKQKDGTFGGVLANLRIKVQSAYKFLEFRKKIIRHLDPVTQNCVLLGRYLLYICKYLSSFSPFASSSPNSAFEEGVTTGMVAFDTPEEKEKFKNIEISLTKADKGPAKATRVIIDALLKIIDAPLEPADDFPARCYLFLCLHDDAKRELILCLTESLKSYSEKSIFTYVKLKNNCRGHEVKRLLIEVVKERPYAVFMFDGVEYADDVLYRSLLEIFDEGTLDDGEGFIIDFRKVIIILTSEAANKHAIADLFDCQPSALRDKDMNQNVERGRTELLPWVKIIQQPARQRHLSELLTRVEIIHRCVKDVKRFRTELLHRVGEIVLLNPTLPEHGYIHRLSRCNTRFMKCSANAVSASFLIKMFQCCDRDDAFFDWLKGSSPMRFHLSGRVGDICQPM